MAKLYSITLKANLQVVAESDDEAQQVFYELVEYLNFHVASPMGQMTLGSKDELADAVSNIEGTDLDDEDEG